MGPLKRANGLVARSGMRGLLAAAMLMVGGGMGAAAALATSPAGAATAHSSLPPVNVNVTNTPNVNVANLPINSAGQLMVQNEAGTGHFNRVGPWVTVGASTQVTIANVTGPGVFKGVSFDVGSQCGCNWMDGVLQVTIDGNTYMSDPLDWFGWPNGCPNGSNGCVNSPPTWYNDPGVMGGGMAACCDYIEGYWNPPGGLPFQHSLVVDIITDWWGQGTFPANVWGTATYTTMPS